MLSYADALRRAPPPTPEILKNFNTNQTNLLFRQIKGYDGTPLTVVRQFSCKDCYKMWWTRVRSFKQVSSCKNCKKKYDPIPADLEFGCGFFDCDNCRNTFLGRIQMGHYSKCFKCRSICYPLYILNKRDDVREYNSRFRHSCSTCNGVGRCPIINEILAFSEIHAPTGSTLASLAIQSDLDERFIDDFDDHFDMPSIREDSTEADSDY